MSCEYCGQYYTTHHPRCPLYNPPKSTHYCSICDEGIYCGEEYIENDVGEYAHYECIDTAKEAITWLGYKIKKMEEEELWQKD